MGLIEQILGGPVGAKRRDEFFVHMVGDRTPGEAMQFLLAGVTHNTQKSGSLSAAQGIFLVVDTFVLDRGWPRAWILVALLLNLGAALLVMTNLRSVFPNFQSGTELLPQAKATRRAFDILASRNFRFNIALYFTFLSNLVLGFAALALVAR